MMVAEDGGLIIQGDYNLSLRDSMADFFIDLIQSCSGIRELDIREFVGIEPMLDYQGIAMGELKKESSASVKSISFGILSSWNIDRLIRDIDSFPNVQNIQFAFPARSSTSQQRRLFEKLFQNIRLPCIDTCAQPPISSDGVNDDDDLVVNEKKQEEYHFLEMIGKRNQVLVDVLDWSQQNRLDVSSEFLHFLLIFSSVSPSHLRASFQSLLQLKVDLSPSQPLGEDNSFMERMGQFRIRDASVSGPSTPAK
jgi:hypothetical protein